MAGKTIKLDIGTIYKKSSEGCYYFIRYQINGRRKAVSLKTKEQTPGILAHVLIQTSTLL